MKFYLGPYLREQPHIFGLCPNHECGQISRLTNIDISYKSKYQEDWLDDIESKEEIWNRKIEGILARQKEMKAIAKEKVEKKVLPEELRRIAPAFFSMQMNPRDIRVISDPIDFINFEGMSVEQTKRIVLLDEAKNKSFRKEIQRNIQSAVDHEHYNWEVLRIDDYGKVTKE